MLLELEEVNPDKPDNDSQTPLSYATRDPPKGVEQTSSPLSGPP